MTLAVIVDEEVPHDLEQPGADICARLIFVKEAVGAEEGFLGKILRFFRPAREAKRKIVE